MSESKLTEADVEEAFRNNPGGEVALVRGNGPVDLREKFLGENSPDGNVTAEQILKYMKQSPVQISYDDFELE